MAFELGKTINGGAEWVCSSSLVFKTLRNPVFVALLVTALTLIIITVMNKEEMEGLDWRRKLKTCVWVTIGVSALTFVHYYALESHLRRGNSSQDRRDVMASINNSAALGGGYAVYAGSQGPSGAERGAPSAAERGAAERGAPSAAEPRPSNVATYVPAARDDLVLEKVLLPSSLAPHT
jgi:hypothetical protein